MGLRVWWEAEDNQGLLICFKGYHFFGNRHFPRISTLCTKANKAVLQYGYQTYIAGSLVVDVGNLTLNSTVRKATAEITHRVDYQTAKMIRGTRTRLLRLISHTLTG